jgi:hypothetical protein
MNKLQELSGRLHSAREYVGNSRRMRMLVFVTGIIMGVMEAILIDILLIFLHLYVALLILILVSQLLGFGYVNAAVLFKRMGLLK